MDNQQSGGSDDRFDRLEALMLGVKSDVAGLHVKITGLETIVVGLKADVGILKTDVGILKTDVGTLKTDVASLKTDIERMSVRLDEVHAGVKIVAEGHGTLVRHVAKIYVGIGRLEEGQEQLDLRMLAIESKLGVPKRPAKRSRSRRT